MSRWGSMNDPRAVHSQAHLDQMKAEEASFKNHIDALDGEVPSYISDLQANIDAARYDVGRVGFVEAGRTGRDAMFVPNHQTPPPQHEIMLTRRDLRMIWWLDKRVNAVDRFARLLKVHTDTWR